MCGVPNHIVDDLPHAVRACLVLGLMWSDIEHVAASNTPLMDDVAQLSEARLTGVQELSVHGAVGILDDDVRGDDDLAAAVVVSQREFGMHSIEPGIFA